MTTWMKSTHHNERLEKGNKTLHTEPCLLLASCLILRPQGALCCCLTCTHMCSYPHYACTHIYTNTSTQTYSPTSWLPRLCPCYFFCINYSSVTICQLILSHLLQTLSVATVPGSLSWLLEQVPLCSHNNACLSLWLHRCIVLLLCYQSVLPSRLLTP